MDTTYEQWFEQVKADIAYEEAHRPSYRTDVVLPYDFCVKVGVKSGFSKEKVGALLDSHFADYGIPKLDDFLWGWRNDSCSFCDERHRDLLLAEVGLVDLPWAEAVLDHVLVGESGTPTDDLLEYRRWQKGLRHDR